MNEPSASKSPAVGLELTLSAFHVANVSSHSMVNEAVP